MPELIIQTTHTCQQQYRYESLIQIPSLSLLFKLITLHSTVSKYTAVVYVEPLMWSQTQWTRWSRFPYNTNSGYLVWDINIPIVNGPLGTIHHGLVATLITRTQVKDPQWLTRVKKSLGYLYRHR